MYHFVARSSVMRRVITGRNFNSYISSAARTCDGTAVAKAQGFGGSQWSWRMMSTTEAAAAKKDVIETSSNAVPETKKEEKGEVVMSSYWGVSRSKITREDGTEWPWNCFMIATMCVLAHCPIRCLNSVSASIIEGPRR